jgi:hypothetical protein
MPSEQRVKLIATMDVARDQLRREWQTVETVLREYTDGYDKMFKHNDGSVQFLGFLRNCSKAYWDLGNLGKVNRAVRSCPGRSGIRRCSSWPRYSHLKRSRPPSPPRAELPPSGEL